MLRLKALAAFAVVGLLAACSSYPVDQLRDAEAVGSPFTKALTDEYRQIATFEEDEMYDHADAVYFAKKGLLSAEGEVVQPEHVEDWDIPADHVDELTSARARLVSLLDAGAREHHPVEAAHAQGRFDCWVEQQEENHQPDHIAACRDEFYAALAALEGVAGMPAMAPDAYIVYFGFDRSDIGPDGAVVIDNAVAAAQRMGVSEFSVTGHADRAGSAEYNDQLSLKRANAVREALIARGVDPSGISVAGRGEAEPAVATPDGVAEQANRRVEIIIQ
jgi:OOP family OmpA-OmpF porin